MCTFENNTEKNTILFLFKEFHTKNKNEESTLNIKWRKINAEGARILLEAIKDDIRPERLNLELKWNNLGITGAEVIFSILKLQNCPKELSFNLQWGNIMNGGAITLAKILMSTKISSKLTFNLRWNNINSIGAGALARAFKIGKCPYQTYIDGLDINDLNEIRISFDIKKLCYENDRNIISRRNSGLQALTLTQPSSSEKNKKIFLDEIIEIIISFLPQPSTSLKTAKEIRREISL